MARICRQSARRWNLQMTWATAQDYYSSQGSGFRSPTPKEMYVPDGFGLARCRRWYYG
jgi:hypothetical protein